MKLPYSCLASHGFVVFAARGGQIQSFHRHHGTRLSTWRHPAAESEEKASMPDPQPVDANGATEGSPEPPSKKQKLDDESSKITTAPGDQAGKDGAQEKDHNEGGSQGGKRRKRGKKPKFHRAPISRRSDFHIIILIVLTADGNHVVAVSGHDKAVWVFEHDGQGKLKELSKRVMPKRPSDIVLSPDGAIIFAADKFGDVHAMPLNITDTKALEGVPCLAVKHARDDSKPSASELTVHSQVNRRSLEMQKKEKERRAAQKQQQQQQEQPAAEDSFELKLLLGHVSMLTSMIIARDEKEGRNFIMTADRDEHVRVSRYIPHAYTIENFCLGHGEFVSRLHVPQRSPETLISGGGDDELFVWNWRAGSLLSRTRVVPDSFPNPPAKIAVTNICSSGDMVFVTCESQPYLFRFSVSTTALVPLDAVRLDGIPLAIMTLPSGELIVALDLSWEGEDNSSAESSDLPQPGCLRVLSSDGATTESVRFDESAAEGEVLDMNREEVTKILYNTEQLRKMEIDDMGQLGEDEEMGDVPLRPGDAVSR